MDGRRLNEGFTYNSIFYFRFSAKISKKGNFTY